MSNHSGSYLLNSVLYVTEEMGIFDILGKDRSREFVLKLIKIGRRYDCNNGEILDTIGEELGICSYCLGESNDFEDGLCMKCRKELSREPEA